MYRIFSNVFQTGRSETTLDYEIIHRDGTPRFLELNTLLRRNRKGRPLGFTVFARDVTERKKREAAFRRNEHAYRLIAENGTEVIETLSPDHHFTFTSPSVERLRGWSVQETLNQTLADVLIPESQKRAAKTIAQELALASQETADPRRSRTLELKMRHKEGEVLSTEATLRFLRDEAGTPVEILWVVRDISERSTSREEIAHLVYHDPLTGLFNRKSFLERLGESIIYATRYSMERAVLYINLNRFKEVNDGWGHDTGDALLREVAQRLRRSLRSTDIVSRLGGDEFTVILNNPVDLYPELAAANLLNVLSLPYEFPGGSVDFVTPSIGVSLFPWDGRDAETLIRKADAAMRRGKHRREAAAERDVGGAVHFYEETLSRPRASAGGRSG
jgi:diguanylate cyclase (GGDEF)-like protein/PAS domain S-box-containing protein